MNKYSLIIFFALGLFTFACDNPWAEHVKINDNVIQENIGDYLASKSEFSTFVELLNATGVYNTLSSSVIYTVWAPTNDAMALVDQSVLNTDEKKKLFVQNHIAFGSYSSKDNAAPVRLTMRSGKILDYMASDAQIDGVSIDRDNEAEVKNGTVQIVTKALVPNYSAWDYVQLAAPDCKFVSFLNSLTTSVFDREASKQIGVNASGRPVYDTIWKVENVFLKDYADISRESLLHTLLIPSDEVFDSEFNKFQKYYRVEDRRNNEFPAPVDSVNIKLMIARDMVLAGRFSKDDAGDSLVSFYGVKVPFVKSAVKSSYRTSNGYVHYVDDCSVGIADKVKSILLEAENSVYSSSMTLGTPNNSRRIRDYASNGFDFVCDNAHSSQILSGVVFSGPVVASIKYRFKIRAINDFAKSYRNADTSVVLIQRLGTVTVLRDPVTNQIKTVSAVTNSLNYTNTAFGVPDVTSDTIFIRRKGYSPIEQAGQDEIDLGYYDFNKSENVFLRLMPLASRMAVTADYFRLVPIIEE